MPLPKTTKYRLFWRRLPLLLLGLFLVVLMPAGAESQDSPIDSGLRSQVGDCVPNNPPGIVEEVSLAAQAEVGDRTYYWLYAYDAPIPEGAGDDPDDPTAPNYEGYPGDLVISVSDGECREDWFNPMGDPIPLSEPLGQEAARLLTLDRYDRTIDRIGRDGLQIRIDSWVEYAEDFGERLRDEERWALEQLGMDIPAILIE